MNTQKGITRKIYLELDPPTDADHVSCQERILRTLRGKGYEDVAMTASVLRSLSPLCAEADWRVTASLAWNGSSWQMVLLEAGDTSGAHYGLAVDLGSTTVVMRMLDCNTGAQIAQESIYNRQIAFGEDILTRIFYSRDDAAHLEELRRATVDTILELMERLTDKTGIDTRRCISMVVAGNTTMIHFLIGMDAFGIFSAPYAVCADQPGFCSGRELEIPVTGYIFCYPGKANYLGGDIISGMVATGMYRSEELSLFFDVGTNGELVVGNRDFLLCGAGAAGPALEGGVVKTGMRAAEGAVQHVKLTDGAFELDVIGGGTPKGICGSGIIDLISELFLNGYLDLRGKLEPDSPGRGGTAETDMPYRGGTPEADRPYRGGTAQADTPHQGGIPECAVQGRQMVVWRPEEEMYAVAYAPGLWFYQSDIDEFMRTKAAAYTMMEYMLAETGLLLKDVKHFYMAGAFGSHVEKEAAVNIGMYPDVELSRIHASGNTSLEGAGMLLLDKALLDDLPAILELMSYVQFGAVEDFLQKMVAAAALPHTDLERYPSVKKRLAEHRR